MGWLSGLASIAFEGMMPSEARTPNRFSRARDGVLQESALRLVALVVGLGLIVGGIVTAVRAEASTTLLLVGAGLLLAALLFGDWLEIVLRHGDTEARIRREERIRRQERAQATVEVVEPTRAALEELAASSDEDVRQALLHLNKNLSDLTTIASGVTGYANTADSGYFGFWSQPWGEATNEVRSDKVFLRFTPAGFTPSILECHVTDESGHKWSSGQRSWLLTKSGPSSEVIFPDHFRDASLEPGSYTVVWEATVARLSTMSYDTGSGATSTILEPRKQEVARDAFVVNGTTREDAG
jgi:hypothetical protein